MKLNLEPSDYAKIAVVSAAIVFVISAVLACSWWNQNGFDTNTTIAIVCTAVCAVFLVVSVWFMARTLRAERMNNVEIVLKYVQGDDRKANEPNEPSTIYKKPKD